MPPATAASRPPGLLLLLTIINANSIMAATMYLPSLPTLGRVLGVPVDALPFTLMVYLAGFAGGQLIFGPLSDRWGRRNLLLGGLVLMAVASVGCAYVESLAELFWMRAAQGFGAAAGMVIGRAVLNDVYNRAEAARATSVVSAALALAPIISPVLGGLVEQYIGWRGNFLISGFITALVVLVLYWGLPETHRPGPSVTSLFAGIRRDYALLLNSRAFMAFCLVNMAIFAGLHGFNAAAPAVMIETMGLSPVAYGALAATGSAGFFIGSVLSSVLSRRLGSARLIDAGVGCLLAGGCGLALYTALWGDSISAIVLARLVWAAGMGLALPNSVTGAVGVNRAALGAGAALAGFMQNVGGGLGSMSAGFLPAGSGLAMALALAGTTLFGLIGWSLNRRQAEASLKDD